MLKGIKTNLLYLTILLLIAIPFRFYNLGYSDYIGDEHKAFLYLDDDQSVWNFFMEQRKGPMQFFVSYIPYLFTQNWNNELTQRVPFAIISVLALLVFYKFIKKLTSDPRLAFFSSFLLMINGFIT